MVMAKSRALTCKKLVEIENAVDSYRRNDIRRLQLKNADTVKWISITLYNTFFGVSRDDLKVLADTSLFLQSIHERLDKEDATIFEQRKKLEIQAQDDKTYFKSKLTQLEK